VLLQSLSQYNGVEIVESIDRRAQSL
jgi:hypothetical protein